MSPSLTAFAARIIGSLVLLGTTFGVAAAQRPVSPDHVTFYTEPNYQGEALTVEAGASVEDLSQMLRPSQKLWAFAISSVRVSGSARALVATSTGLGGERLEITRSIPDLYGEERGSGGTWDRAIVSVAVTGPRAVTPATVPSTLPGYRTIPAPVYVVPRPSPAPPVRHVRPLYDTRTVDIIIHRAYREALGRRADPDGLHHYSSASSHLARCSAEACPPPRLPRVSSFALPTRSK